MKICPRTLSMKKDPAQLQERLCEFINLSDIILETKESEINVLKQVKFVKLYFAVEIF